jgi:hypothetical protein
MAQKPDGKPAKTERVTFTRPAAERIAKVVRTVEGGDRDQPGITYGSAPGGVAGKVFRVATFTGAWSINAEKTVTFRGVTATPNTVSAMNLFFPVTNTATGDRSCAIAKDGTAWHLVGVQVSTAAVTVVKDIAVSGSLNTANCSISIARTLTTATASVVVYGV